MLINEEFMAQLADRVTELRLDGRTYTFVETVRTVLTTDYVPDWDLRKALGESVQNALDESVQGHAKAVPRCAYYVSGVEQVNKQYFHLRDTGRGVPLEEILLLGASGKRLATDVVGHHGEGELVSFLVTLREGVTKLMASRGWLVVGRLEPVNGHSVLVLDHYTTSRPRKGTAWYYVGPGTHVAYERVREEYARHRANTRRRTRVWIPENTYRPQLFSRGKLVESDNSSSGLVFSYDLDAVPGRDRSAFSVPAIRDELVELLSKHLTVQLLSYLMQCGTYKAEYRLTELDLPAALVKRAARNITANGKRSKWSVLWAAGPDDRPRAVDNQRQGRTVLEFHSEALVPTWVRYLPRVTEATSYKGQSAHRAPGLLRTSTALVLECLGPAGYVTSIMAVPHFRDNPTVEALADSGTGAIILSQQHVQQMTFTQFVGLLAHEVAHLITRSDDCTREHAAGIQMVTAHLAVRLAEQSDTRKKFAKAQRLFNRWQSKRTKEAK